LLNQVIPDENGIECSGLDLYFIDRVGESFKATLLWRPYFFVSVIENFHIVEVSQRLQRKYEKCNVEIIEKEDLDMPNHLCNKYRKFVKLSFNTVSDLVEVRGELRCGNIICNYHHS
jgi:DNA polymerase epsilon subunit 1